MAEIKSTNKYLIKRKYKTINGTTYPMDEYQVILYEEDSEDCGYIRPQYQWSATTGYICDFETYTKYSREVKMVSYDSGTTWSVAQPVEERRGEVIAYDSYDCGKPMYRCIETDETYCEDNGDDFAASFYRNNEIIPRVTIECSDSVIYEQDKDYFSSTDYHSQLAASSITQVNIGDCVTEFRKFYWSFSSATLTIGNNVRLVWDRAIGGDKFTKHLTFSNPIVLPQSVKKIEEHEINGTTCYIKPLANPSVDEFAIRRVDEYTHTPVVEGNYNIVAPYGTKYNWEQLKLIEQISGGTVVQEHYETPNENWKAKITFKGYYNESGSSTFMPIENERTLYLADDPTHTLGANELNNMSNLLAGGGTNAGDYRWESSSSIKRGFRYTNGSYNYDVYAIKEIEINGSVSAITSGAISGFSRYSAGSYITDRVGYPSALNIKFNEGLLVFGDKINLGISANSTYYNYQIEFPSSLTAITSFDICESKQVINHVTYGYTLKFTSVIPPRIENNGALNNAVKILVPCGSLNRYLTEWSQYADKIEPDSFNCLAPTWIDEGSYTCVNDKVCHVERKYMCLNSNVCYPTDETRTIATNSSCEGFQFVESVAVSANVNDYITLFESPDDIDEYRIQFGLKDYELVNSGSGGITLMKDLNNSYCEVYTSLESQTMRSQCGMNFTLLFQGKTYVIRRSTWDWDNNEFEFGAIYLERLSDGSKDGNKDDPAYVLDIINRKFVAYVRHTPWRWIKVYKKISNTWTLVKDLIPVLTDDDVYTFYNLTDMELSYNVEYRTAPISDYICDGGSKYYKRYKYVTYDFGANWANTGEYIKGNLYEPCSIDCNCSAPEGYTKVEYITSENTPSGETGPYIDTNFIPNQNTRVAIDFQATSLGDVSTHRRLFGSGNEGNASSGNYLFTVQASKKTIIGVYRCKVDNGSSSWGTTFGTPDLNRHYVNVNDNRKVVLDNDEVAIIDNNTISCIDNLCLFNSILGGVVGGAGQFFIGRIYSCQIYDNGVMVRNFLPCIRNNDNVVGLYDLVNGVFYISADSNYQFDAGPIV